MNTQRFNTKEITQENLYNQHNNNCLNIKLYYNPNDQAVKVGKNFSRK